MNRAVLPLIMAGYLGVAVLGIDWGLHTPARDAFMFPPGTTWSAQRVAEMRAAQPAEPGPRGADVDPDQIAAPQAMIQVNASPERIAEIYARYLLYSGQPDEMITFRAIAEMDPQAGRFDPKLYQYGGLFIYPVALLLRIGAACGWVTLSSLDHYLVHPEDFGRFYIVARAMVVAWGLLGVWAAAALGALLGDRRSGALAAVLFALLPAVVSLSHEAKPHLPGTVLMLWTMVWSLRYLDSGRVLHRTMVAVCGGLALGMVISSLWILALIPLIEILRSRSPSVIWRTGGGLLIAGAAYVLTNPYVLINAIANRSLLASNFGNSTAMYDLSHPLANVARAWHLLVSGSSPWIVVGGLIMTVALFGRDPRRLLVVLLPGALVLVQFVALAADKPGEYGRFALLPNVVLATLAAVGTCRLLACRPWQYSVYGVALAGTLAWPMLDYVERFAQADGPRDSRYVLAADVAELLGQSEDTLGVLRDPAPYGFPPADFSRIKLMRLPADVAAWPADRSTWPKHLVVPVNGVEGVDLQQILDDGFYQLRSPEPPVDRAGLTWAAKPLVLLRAADDWRSNH